MSVHEIIPGLARPSDSEAVLSLSRLCHRRIKLSHPLMISKPSSIHLSQQPFGPQPSLHDPASTYFTLPLPGRRLSSTRLVPGIMLGQLSLMVWVVGVKQVTFLLVALCLGRVRMEDDTVVLSFPTSHLLSPHDISLSCSEPTGSYSGTFSSLHSLQRR